MRVPILLACSALISGVAPAEPLSSADRETLLENLEKIREAADSKVDARFRLALTAYRNAMSSDDAAIDLYLNCMEKVNFEEQRKKAADFREWKRKEAEKLSDGGLRLALRHQLRWLILTLQAASDKADRVKLAGEAQEAIDSIFRDAEKLQNQEGLLNQAVTSSVFARAYDINNVKVEKWSLSPIQLQSIYEEILLPAYRRPSALAGLRGTWIKRIQQETLKMEHWSEKGGGREDREEKRIGTADSMQSPAYSKFIEEGVPKLQWDMEIDLFRNGDESGAAVRMLAHLEKYLAHPSAREWGDAFKLLLKPAVAAGAPAAARNTGEAAP